MSNLINVVIFAGSSFHYIDNSQYYVIEYSLYLY